MMYYGLNLVGVNSGLNLVGVNPGLNLVGVNSWVVADFLC